MVSGKEIRRKVVRGFGFVLFGFGIISLFGTVFIGSLVGVVISIVVVSVGFVLYYTAARPYERHQQKKQHEEEGKEEGKEEGETPAVREFREAVEEEYRRRGANIAMGVPGLGDTKQNAEEEVAERFRNREKRDDSGENNMFAL